jgi:hypothetical protein
MSARKYGKNQPYQTIRKVYKSSCHQLFPSWKEKTENKSVVTIRNKSIIPQQMPNLQVRAYLRKSYFPPFLVYRFTAKSKLPTVEVGLLPKAMQKIVIILLLVKRNLLTEGDDAGVRAIKAQIMMELVYEPPASIIACLTYFWSCIQRTSSN